MLNPKLKLPLGLLIVDSFDLDQDLDFVLNPKLKLSLGLLILDSFYLDQDWHFVLNPKLKENFTVNNRISFLAHEGQREGERGEGFDFV